VDAATGHGLQTALAGILPTGHGLLDLLALAGIAAVLSNLVFPPCRARLAANCSSSRSDGSSATSRS
jgi:hypothetical protein